MHGPCHVLGGSRAAREPIAERRGDRRDRQPGEHVDSVVVPRVDAGHTESGGDDTEPPRRLRVLGVKSERERPRAGHVSAREAATGHRRVPDDHVNHIGEQLAFEGTQPRHDVRVLPWTSSGQERVPHARQQEPEHHAGERGVKPARRRFTTTSVAAPREEDPADDRQSPSGDLFAVSPMIWGNVLEV